MPAGHVAVGRILGPHGLRGEVKVQPLTGHMAHFAKGRRLWTGDCEHEVESSRHQKDSVLLKLADLTSIKAAEALRNSLISLPESELAQLPEDEYYTYQLIGLDVYATDGAGLGKVTGLIPTGSNDVYVVEGSRGEVLLPAIDDVVLEVDIPNRRMVVSLMEGMLPE
jgi:16S rRNA processing protein RimM